jgi:4-amino-4-deoxy-L-arabinose transferase-like glycosyltransferase
MQSTLPKKGLKSVNNGTDHSEPDGRIRRWLQKIDNATDGNLILLIAVTAICVRVLFYVTAFEGLKDVYGWLSDDNYDEIAVNFLAGNGYVIHMGDQPNMIRPPVYPLFLILHYLIFGESRIFLAIVQSILQAGACVVLYKLTKSYIRDQRIAFISSMVMALYPQSMLYASQVATESLYLLLMMITVYLFLSLTAEPHRGLFYVLGAMLGVLTLCKPVSQLLFIPVCIVIAYRYRKNKGLAAKRIVKIMFALVVVVSPWTIRNYIVSGDFVPVATRGGRFLYSNTISTSDEEQVAFEMLQSEGIENPDEEDSEWFNLAVDNILKNPGSFIRNTLRTSSDFWYRGHSRSVSIFNAFINFPLLFFGILGLRTAWKKGMHLLPILALIIYFNGIYGLLHAMARYALPVIPLIIMFGVLGIFGLYGLMNGIPEKQRETDGIDG